MRALIETTHLKNVNVFAQGELISDDLIDPLQMSSAFHPSVDKLLPEPIQIFTLWQTYLDRVNPLTKIIHVPTVQPLIMHTMTDWAALSFPHQALLFSILAMAVVSLDETETVQLLGVAREKAIQDFNAGTKVALNRSNFLQNYDMVTIQALLIHLVCATSHMNAADFHHCPETYN